MNKYYFTKIAAAVAAACLLLSASVTQAAPIVVPGFLKFESYPGITGTPS